MQSSSASSQDLKNGAALTSVPSLGNDPIAGTPCASLAGRADQAGTRS